jgi:hypothetical protein
MTVGSVILLTTQVGIPDALVQRQEVSPAHEATSFWCGLVSASCAAIALYAGAGLIARLMLMPRLAECLRLLCIPIVIEGASATASARLRRRLEFGALATADVAAELAFIVVALGSLWLNLQRWSLTLGLAARMTIHGFWVSFADGYVPSDRPRLDALRDLWKFGLNVQAGALLNTLSYNADFILIGRFMGPDVLSYYSIALELLRFAPYRIHRGRQVCVLVFTACRIATGPGATIWRCPRADRGDLAASSLLRDRRAPELLETTATMVAGRACSAIAAPESRCWVGAGEWAPSTTPRAGHNWTSICIASDSF